MKEFDLSTLNSTSAATVGEGFQFSFPAPPALVKLVTAIQSLGPDPNELFDRVLGLYPRGFAARYPTTPIEFFPIGSTGMDGEHIGFVNRAPELGLDDLPFAFLTPMDSRGAFCVGTTSREGLERLMSFHLQRAEAGGETELAGQIREVAAIAEFILNPSAVGDLGPFYGGPALQADGAPMRIPVNIPEGYHFEDSADGIGVLAPAPTFKPGMTTPAFEAMEFTAMDAMYEEGVAELLADGFAGSALLFVKHCHYSEGADASDLLSTCYTALGRPRFAEVAGQYEGM